LTLDSSSRSKSARGIKRTRGGRSQSPWETSHPSLVSFVGQTGAGKSTLVKLLIHLKASQSAESVPAPIAGIPGRDLPTSADIHLYADPRTVSSARPILYADCEGLDGGEREPLAAAVRRSRDGRSNASTDGDSEDSQFYAERQITWANSDTKRTREFAVAHLYPRILFAFSDVVVFVHRNPRSAHLTSKSVLTNSRVDLSKACWTDLSNGLLRWRPAAINPSFHAQY
jgi:energy-coupling factor transporter ATP-binding protein EcfA2